MPTTSPNTQVSIKRRPRSPRAIVDNFEVETIAPSFVASHVPYRVSNRRTRQQILVPSSMRSEHMHETPVISQMNAALVPFSTFAKSSAPTTFNITNKRIPQTTKPSKQAHLPQAGTVVELAKHRPITHHIGATHHRYPSTLIGDTLLKQQAILTINNLPSLIGRLKQDLVCIKRTRADNMNATPERTERKYSREQTSDPNFFHAADSADAADAGDNSEADQQASDQETASETETQNDLDLLSKQMRDAENVLLRFDARSTRKIGARELAELKQMGVVDKETETVTQREAHSIITAEIAQLEAAILDLGS
jgi:hypothetical protein